MKTKKTKGQKKTTLKGSTRKKASRRKQNHEGEAYYATPQFPFFNLFIYETF